MVHCLHFSRFELNYKKNYYFSIFLNEIERFLLFIIDVSRNCGKNFQKGTFIEFTKSRISIIFLHISHSTTLEHLEKNFMGLGII